MFVCCLDTLQISAVFSTEEIELLKAEAFKRFGNGKPLYKQSAVYFLMLNTGLRSGEVCGLLNSAIDLAHSVDFPGQILQVFGEKRVFSN